MRLRDLLNQSDPIIVLADSFLRLCYCATRLRIALIVQGLNSDAIFFYAACVWEVDKRALWPLRQGP
jgi:hypothetical protein